MGAGLDVGRGEDSDGVMGEIMLGERSLDRHRLLEADRGAGAGVRA